MVGNGGLEEALVMADLDPALPAAKLLGLRPLVAHARGELDRDAAILQAVTATRQFAKRQMTWFRKEPGVQWLMIEHSESVAHTAALVIGQVERFLLTLEGQA